MRTALFVLTVGESGVSLYHKLTGVLDVLFFSLYISRLIFTQQVIFRFGELPL